MPTQTPSASCMDEYDPNSLSVEQARDRIDNLVIPLSETETLDIKNLLGRVLATEIRSPIDVPNYINSAMDGYAINASDIPSDGTAQLIIAATILAGDTTEISIRSGECARIMTGARLPVGADTVIMQEHVQREQERITIDNRASKGQNVRQAGEDIARNDMILPAGHMVSAADIGLLASIGIAQVETFRKVRVAYFSTGDELVSLGNDLRTGQLYDSNRYTLWGMLSEIGAEIIDLGVIPDQQPQIEQALREAANIADVIITTGGVSVGEADFVKNSLEKIGKVDFWKIAMKPGRPLAFGSIQQKLFFGLPGNPVSTMATFHQFVLPAFHKLSGRKIRDSKPFQATCLSGLRKRKGRKDFQRGILSVDDKGNLVVRSTGKQGSHILRSMSQANCFIILDEDCEQVEAGSSVAVQAFKDWI